MSYRPKHPLIVVVNADGSGYTLQFSTLAEAKTAYASTATDGVAYLYSSSKNSLSSGDGYEAIPEYNNGMTYGTGALVSLNGTVYRLINFIGAGGYGPITHSSLWTTNVVLPSALPPISSSGFTDGARRGMTFTTAQNIGFPPSECPSAGTILEEANISPIIIPIYGQQVEVGTTVYNLVADGACDSYEVTTSVGYVPNGTLVASDATNNYFSNGEGGYYLEALPPSPPNIIGYEGFEDFLTNELFSAVYRTRVRPQYDDNTVGEWSEWSYTAYGTLYGSDTEYNYYSDGADSYYSEAKPVCDSAGTQVSGSGGDHTVDVGCGAYILGTYYDNTYADGACGTYNESGSNYVPAGTSIGTCGTDNYISNGNGTYYSESNCEDQNLHANEAGWTYDGCYWSYVEPCTAEGTIVSEDSGNYYANVGCGDWVVGSYSNITYADGACGTYSGGGYSYLPTGTFVAACNNYNYHSDGVGSVYQGESLCDNPLLHHDDPSWTYDGCYWSQCPAAGTVISETTTPITVDVGCGGFWVGTQYEIITANGNCLTNSEVGQNYEPAGQFVGFCDIYGYYSDGVGGVVGVQE